MASEFEFPFLKTGTTRAIFKELENIPRGTQELKTLHKNEAITALFNLRSLLSMSFSLTAFFTFTLPISV